MCLFVCAYVRACVCVFLPLFVPYLSCGFMNRLHLWALDLFTFQLFCFELVCQESFPHQTFLFVCFFGGFLQHILLSSGHYLSHLSMKLGLSGVLELFIAHFETPNLINILSCCQEDPIGLAMHTYCQVKRWN